VILDKNKPPGRGFAVGRNITVLLQAKIFCPKVGRNAFFDCVVIEGQNPQEPGAKPAAFLGTVIGTTGKGGESLKPRDETHVRYEFDSYCKKVLKFNARNYYARKKRLGECEVPFSELSEHELSRLSAVDEYHFDKAVFDVQGEAVSVSNTDLAEALKTLSQEKRDIVLMSYFTGMSDGEIAERMDTARSTVQHRRASSLRELRKRLEENGYE
jgi:RNA polymerase sigma factor (sigma-70 family)